MCDLLPHVPCQDSDDIQGAFPALKNHATECGSIRTARAIVWQEPRRAHKHNCVQCQLPFLFVFTRIECCIELGPKLSIQFFIKRYRVELCNSRHAALPLDYVFSVISAISPRYAFPPSSLIPYNAFPSNLIDRMEGKSHPFHSSDRY
ncbi:hypothetical protein O6U65_1087 [Saccharomyces cerevisiae synthetic construct]|uniref:Putative uncharacterized protein YJL211C n=1 Tax=Saccharomyces cerevisiae (strain ATCC 204508 / S288c) TaxID=559292 RepID=YJV1_YEAST|nr:RecName: Full=Putative uncharacterized protein YJL211C [Saccharomyces cerevisiae S288C]WNV73186.1 hypothetical protein O6U65_1087 [Saccharomyces cerevisiae synthetic construct]CAA84001.1 ORF [Saccharomyces cerevisiae]CAA89507.1 unnamed protein product [Saccharomyces cerevisiae]